MTEPGLGLPRPSIAGARGLEDLLYDLRELIETARMMPMSASVLVNRDEALTLVEDVLAALPTELREARFLLKERDEFRAEAQREAAALVESARVQAERMVERTEISREARHTAEEIIATAEADARRLSHEAEDYIDARLAAFEAGLERTLATIRKGRQRLQVPLPPSEDGPDDEPRDVFDQDT
jgi:regulator of protease activity HflC (stomatin/prohibitin superfamily)